MHIISYIYPQMSIKRPTMMQPAIRYNNVHPTMKGCPSPMGPFVKYCAPRQKRKWSRRPGRTRRRRVTFMSCPASAGAAETANGAVERMVLLGLTSRIIPNFAAMRSRRGRNQLPRNPPRLPTTLTHAQRQAYEIFGRPLSSLIVQPSLP